MVVAGVDVTALVIAYAREVESERSDRLFSDPWAQLFVDASGRERPDPKQTAAGRAGPTGAGWVSVRTRFIDDAVLAAAQECRQIVLLGAGLDTRALRLTWPPATTVFEVDTSTIFDFKEPVIRDATVEQSPQAATRVLVDADVTGDLAHDLRAAGLSNDLPTAWIAEGLLLYLTPQQNDRLLATIAGLSPAGSQLIVTLLPEGQGPRDDASADKNHGWRNQHRVSDGPADPMAWLAGHGWIADEPEHVGTLATRYGRDPAPEDAPDLPPRRLLMVARRTSASTPDDSGRVRTSEYDPKPAEPA